MRVRRAVCALVLREFTRAALKSYGPCPARAHASRTVRRALLCLEGALVAEGDSDEEAQYWRSLLGLYRTRARAVFPELAASSSLPASVPRDLQPAATLLDLDSRAAGGGGDDALPQLAAIASAPPASGTRTAALNNMAAVHFGRGRKALTFANLNRAMAAQAQDDCGDPGALYLNAGRAFLRFHEFEPAYDALELAAQCDPSSPRVWLHMAECAARLCCDQPAWPRRVEGAGSIAEAPPRACTQSGSTAASRPATRACWRCSRPSSPSCR